MTNSDAPTDRDDVDGDAGISRRTTGDGSGAAPDGADTGHRSIDEGSESGPDASRRTGSGEAEDAAGADTSDGQVVPRLVHESDNDGADPTDATAAQAPEPIEPETPRAENAAFVLLGVLGTIALLATVIAPGTL